MRHGRGGARRERKKNIGAFDKPPSSDTMPRLALAAALLALGGAQVGWQQAPAPVPSPAWEWDAWRAARLPGARGAQMHPPAMGGGGGICPTARAGGPPRPPLPAPTRPPAHLKLTPPGGVLGDEDADHAVCSDGSSRPRARTHAAHTHSPLSPRPPPTHLRPSPPSSPCRPPRTPSPPWPPPSRSPPAWRTRTRPPATRPPPSSGRTPPPKKVAPPPLLPSPPRPRRASPSSPRPRKPRQGRPTRPPRQSSGTTCRPTRWRRPSRLARTWSAGGRQSWLSCWPGRQWGQSSASVRGGPAGGASSSSSPKRRPRPPSRRRPRPPCPSTSCSRRPTRTG
jgi:hypothetical protein